MDNKKLFVVNIMVENEFIVFFGSVFYYNEENEPKKARFISIFSTYSLIEMNTAYFDNEKKINKMQQWQQLKFIIDWPLLHEEVIRATLRLGEWHGFIEF